jgi:hypothetical protein
LGARRRELIRTTVPRLVLGFLGVLAKPEDLSDYLESRHAHLEYRQYRNKEGYS